MYCAFGFDMLDRRGRVIEESDNYYVIKSPEYAHIIVASLKSETRVFNTEEERDNWIKNQNYQYDNR
jgi:hypothetical protein